ncbi:hypothetical protein SAMN04488107_1408 [Geodermatophilus saharensis]|uniref:Uncharacterized protein n=1 Tax=Geodermatophilus saharensis TaxID=1137994 RepID=A0A239BSL2_9ACTN|nr:hypothetical protein [Geodermatophilus saharensis]SNS10886.1 hypothetical protein SAMN04488107_1408 [Geodermatophilus saharensis]
MTGRRGAVRARLRRGTGPAARPDDRVELLCLVLCTLLAVLAVPVGLAVGTAVGTDASAEARSQRELRSEVPAVLLEDGRALTGTEAVALASWTAPDGSSGEDEVRVPAGTRAGDTVRIWLDADGRRTGAPLSETGVRVTAAVAGTVTALLLAASAVTLHAAVRALLDRARSRRWAREWAEVEPVWAARFRLR